MSNLYIEIVEKEVQDTSCRGDCGSGVIIRLDRMIQMGVDWNYFSSLIL